MACLIDKYLPDYTFNEYHKRVIHASANKCFVAAKELDLGKSFISKLLLKLRGLPARDLKLRPFLRDMCFTFLEEKTNNEFVIDASRRRIKIFWNFYFNKLEENKTVVSTETRILCLTKRSKVLFSVYWFFVKPFSGIIRLEMLRLIKKKAENS